MQKTHRLPGKQVVLLLMLSACSAATPSNYKPTSQEALGEMDKPVVLESAATASITPLPPTPPALMATPSHLLEGLARDCVEFGRGQSGLREGEPAIDFTLQDTTGISYHLGSLLTQKPVVLIFGSFT